MQNNPKESTPDGYKLCYVLYDGSHPENFCRNAEPFYGEFTGRDTWINRVSDDFDGPHKDVEVNRPIAAWITPFECCMVHPGQYVGNTDIKGLVLPDNHMPIEWFKKLDGVKVTEDGCVLYRDAVALAKIQQLASENRSRRFSELNISFRGERNEPWLSGEVDHESVVSERITMEEYQGIYARTKNIDALAYKYFGKYLESNQPLSRNLAY